MEPLTQLIVALTGLIAALAPVLVKLWRRDDVTDDRVDQLWRAHLRRGLAEGLTKNFIQERRGEIAVVHTLSPEVEAAYLPIAAGLRQIHSDNAGLTPERLVQVIETHYGDWLGKFICRTLGINDYACLQMALMVAYGRGVDVNQHPSDATDPSIPKVSP